MTAHDPREPLIERLLRARHLAAEDVSAVEMRDLTRARYHLIEVRVHGDARFIAKAARTPDVAPLLTRERCVLAWLARAVPDVSAPRLLAGVDRDGWIVTTHLGDAAWASAHDTELEGLACALADVHRAGLDPRQRRGLPMSAVAMLLLPKLASDAARDTRTSGAVRYLVDHWTGATTIHGDVKWEHVRGRGSPGLIDWELGGLGDPAWDLASLLHELCLFEVSARSLGVALSAYRARLGRELSRAFLVRCAAAVATRFVQSAGEYASAGAARATIDRSRSQSLWWATHPDALDACLREAA